MESNVEKKAVSNRWYYGQRGTLITIKKQEKIEVFEELYHPNTKEKRIHRATEKIVDTYIDIELKRKEIKRRGTNELL